MQNKKGFTLIELLIVVVIIGILAAIALPKFGQARERAYVSAMQSDLRNLQTAQEMYYAGSNYQYIDVATITDQAEHADLGFQASSGVSIAITANGGPGVGYTATASHVAFGAAGTYDCELNIGATGTQGIACTDNR